MHTTSLGTAAMWIVHFILRISWWRHQMETFSALLPICAGKSPVPGEFPAQRPVTRSFNVFFDLHLNKRLSKQPWGWWFETLPLPLSRHNNVPKAWHFLVIKATIISWVHLYKKCNCISLVLRWSYFSVFLFYCWTSNRNKGLCVITGKPVRSANDTNGISER